MKRILAIVLVLLMLCGIALAEGNDIDQGAQLAQDAAEAALPEEFPAAGFTLHFPEEFHGIQGTLMPMGGMELKPGVTFTMLNYLGMSQEDLLALEGAEDQEAVMDALGRALAPLCMVIGIEGGEGIDSFVQSMGGSIGEDEVTELARVGDTTFYGITSSFDGTLEPGFQEEYEKLSAMMGDVLASADYYEPVDLYAAAANAALSFETTDMDGTPVSSAEFFARHEYTLVNIWASWCGPCINELAELQAINGRLAELDCAVVGLLYDGDKEEARETARAILAEKGVEYPVLIVPENMDEQFVVKAFPTTYIVDRNGVIVGDPIVGAYVERYEPAVKELLGK